MRPDISRKPQPANVDLTGVIAKLDWAERHIETFRQTVEHFEARKPATFGFRTEKHPRADGSVEYELYAIIRKPPPRELALIAGDVAHNVRSALDHLVYVLSSRTAQRSGKTQFPIFTDECRFKVLGVPKIESIRGPERTLIENVQPFAAAVDPANDPLAILNRLSNIDKHRLPLTTVAAAKEQDTWISSDNADCHFTFVARGGVEHDERIVAFTATPQDTSRPMVVHPQSGLQVQLSEKGWVNEMEALSLLRMIYEYARFTVIEHWFKGGYMPPTLAEREGRAAT
jgi:hypothetical protein